MPVEYCAAVHIVRTMSAASFPWACMDGPKTPEVDFTCSVNPVRNLVWSWSQVSEIDQRLLKSWFDFGSMPCNHCHILPIGHLLRSSSTKRALSLSVYQDTKRGILDQLHCVHCNGTKSFSGHTSHCGRRPILICSVRVLHVHTKQ